MLRWILAGIGDIATKRVLPAILAEPRSCLAGVVTRSPAKAESYGVPGWPDLATALAEARPDLVYISTPVFLHAPQTIEALRAGAHVLCEKPMALNYDDALSMERAAAECGRALGVAYYRRMYPKIARLRELLAAGAIGKPVVAEATAHDWFYPDHGQRSWLVEPELAGGGPLRDTASHRIDLFNYLFGRPLAVCGQLSTVVHPIRVEDNATVLIEYQGGLRAIVDVRRHSRVSRDEFRVRGTEGEIDLTPLNSPTLVHPGGVEELPAHANLHYPAVEDFVSAILEGRPPRSSASTALATEWAMEQVTPRPPSAAARTSATQ